MPGLKPVLELLAHSPERVDAVFLRKGRHSRDMESIVDACRAAGVRFSLLPPPSFARIYAGKSQGVVARLFEAGFMELDALLDTVQDAPLPLLLALDQVQDPGNAGTLARSLYAMGGAGIIVPRHNGVYLGAAAAKAAAGALELLPVAKSANLGQALDKAGKLGITVYGAVSLPPAAPAPQERTKARPGQAPAALSPLNIFYEAPRLPALLVLGSEDSGLRPGMEKRCDFLVSIPMLRDFDSLNVAQAGAMLLAWFARHQFMHQQSTKS
ncbi:23S rRNA (guanosine(2251)-2'-O)-methyltransferase RlmB [Desulfovibrio sp. OttesenSCG-928-A18]|nr:23S rRNA (guanosine(2251)-2'-O)-methyltransferase RlmB [Desulfovibrio sp. OttesenSCG-928-A18]